MSLDSDGASVPDRQAVSAEPKGKRARNRAENEKSILDAFERIMARDGIRGVGPNAIMEEAGLGKPLLYTYFGDLNGLIRAWGERRKLWPDNEDLDQQVMMPGDTADPKEFIKQSVIMSANYLRDNPVALEVLAEELVAPSEITQAFDDIRNQRGNADEEHFPHDHPARARENFRLLHILWAAGVYFALRARTSPRLQGIHLDTDEGWEDTMAMLGELVDDVMLASKVRRAVAKTSDEQD
jgi:AcrR family transcriptional regulator